MDRRLFLAALGVAGASAGAVALRAGMLTGEAAPLPPPPPRAEHRGRHPLRPHPAAFPLPPHFSAPALERTALPWGSIFDLPGDGNLVALTVDDGNSSETLALYLAFAALSGMRLTFFLNGSQPSWTEHASTLRPLIESGQVQVANHTWSHPSLTELSDGAIADELERNDEFIRTTYGVEARPYYRPPYGRHDERVDAAARSVGYSTPVMWYGSLSDATEISDADLMASATSWLLPQHIVIGHANYLTVTRHFTEIAGIIAGRGLQPVTLDDVFQRS